MSSQPKVTILIPEASGGGFMLWKWSEKDYGKSVSVFVGDCKVDITFVRNTYSKEQERVWPIYMQYKMTFDYPSQTFIKGLINPDSDAGEDIAKEIYRIYDEATEKLVFFARYKLNLPSVISGIKTRFDELFYGRGYMSNKEVMYQIGSSELKQFVLQRKKNQAGIRTQFEAKNLLTPEKWNKLDQYSKTKPDNMGEVEELVKIKAKAVWGESRIPVIETMALLEVVFRNKAQKELTKRGLSKKKLKESESDIGMSILLNTVLPLILTTKENEKHKELISSVNMLRRIRNDIMHNNLKESEIDNTLVIKGIEAAIKLTQIIS